MQTLHKPIDMAAARMAEEATRLPTMDFFDRGFVSDITSIQKGPIGGSLDSEGNWQNEYTGTGAGVVLPMALVQLDRASLEESGWEIVWKDAKKRSPPTVGEGLVLGLSFGEQRTGSSSTSVPRRVLS